MSLSTRLLSFLISQATRHRDQSAAESKQSAAALQATRDTQHSLTEFAEQKSSERRAAVDQPSAVSAVVGQTRFSGKLKIAMSLQAEQVTQSEAAFEQTRTELSRAQRKLHALQLLEERKNNREKSKARQVDQKIQDEIAAGTKRSNKP